MTTSTLAWLITLALFTQFAAVLFAWYRRRQTQSRGFNDSPQASREVEIGASPRRSSGLAWDGFKPFRVIRRVVENRAGNVCSFYLSPSEPMLLPVFSAGQFLTLRFELPTAEGEVKTLVRCYSLSDQSRPDVYRISVKREQHGLVSNYLHEQISEGDTLMLKAPSGHFHLHESSRLPLVLIAGGIGITPMLSMLLTLLNQDSEAEIWLFYAVRSGQDVIMHDQLLALAEYHPRFHLHICFSRPAAGDRFGIDYHHAGRIDIPLLQSVLHLRRYQFYVCGPGALMESIVPGLESIGISPDDIHYEAFGPASVNRSAEKRANAAPASAQPWRVTFSHSGHSLEWNGAHDCLLNMAEAEGVAVESGCRAGSCGGCQTRIEKGEVEYSQEAIADVAQGHCLLCISRPKSDLVLAV